MFIISKFVQISEKYLELQKLFKFRNRSEFQFFENVLNFKIVLIFKKLFCISNFVWIFNKCFQKFKKVQNLEKSKVFEIWKKTEFQKKL